MMPTLDLTTAVWRKSSYSDGGANNCLEVADNCPGTVPVRDSKRPDGPILVFGVSPWASFLTYVTK
ncbi:DUF397 domain-containing protein [Streptomyces sp. 378]|uniref:DUF397 domain-containing protein n=1 Tax=Streptomyces sp. 378 TaxID=3049412 RepID=UPI0024C40347|nr:DUF397 domain-containing protein [Streptomyces sp. 378]MDK1347484.1 DUF397 domain-containing protein [Streptomyces sp. 378]